MSDGDNATPGRPRASDSNGANQWLSRSPLPPRSPAPWERKPSGAPEADDDTSSQTNSHTDGVTVADLIAKVTGATPTDLPSRHAAPEPEPAPTPPRSATPPPRQPPARPDASPPRHLMRRARCLSRDGTSWSTWETFQPFQTITMPQSSQARSMHRAFRAPSNRSTWLPRRLWRMLVAASSKSAG